MSVYVGSDKIYQIYKGDTLIYQEKYSYPKDCVDLGLPSGLRWCTHNIVDSSDIGTPYSNGLFFQFGSATIGYVSGSNEVINNSSWGTSPCMMGDGSDYDYSIVSAWDETYTTNTVLKSSVDTAIQTMSTGWRMPTYEECKELLTNTNISFGISGNILGATVTNKSDSSKSIFLPAVGYYKDGEWVGQPGLNGYIMLWSASIEEQTSQYAFALFWGGTGSTSMGLLPSYRYIAAPIRPVFDISLIK